MNSPKSLFTYFFALFMAALLIGCGSVEQAAQNDCTSIGWEIGSKGYQDCANWTTHSPLAINPHHRCSNKGLPLKWALERRQGLDG
jgi:outer membrane biogenesis lipoprotein LolB